MSSEADPLYNRVTERVAMAAELLAVLEDSDRYWSSQVRVLEEQLALSLGLTKPAFDTLYYQVLGTIQPGTQSTVPGLNQRPLTQSRLRYRPPARSSSQQGRPSTSHF
ncbi:uncharacterized protein LOC124358730 [Homalodisca vitripennis]|uniref:uncharacterized protein LOC124358730 n=1 Tax=Homalodisca vitripennis TaxID=197043 RepID=UPI001EEC9D1A|nr:uncharacterized protein LOC124358730 [Homalodisca vitripennis]KAG8318010.1 hypothetical protein J6590_108699 [Homalodisca vitripennis]